MAIHAHAMEVAAITMPRATVARAQMPVMTMRRRAAAFSAAMRAARRARSLAMSRTALLLRRSMTGRLRPVVPWCMLPPLVNARSARMVPLAWSHVSNSVSFVWMMRSFGEKRSISRDWTIAVRRATSDGTVAKSATNTATMTSPPISTLSTYGRLTRRALCVGRVSGSQTFR